MESVSDLGYYTRFQKESTHGPRNAIKLIGPIWSDIELN